MNSKYLKNVTIRQINIIIVASLAMIIFVVVWIYIYIPIESGLNDLSSELTAANNRISKLEASIPEDKEFESVIADLRKQHSQIVQKVPDDEDVSLEQLSEFAQALDLDVLAVQKMGTKWLLDENKRKVMVEGKQCEILSVTMKLKGSYKSIVDFLSGLKQSVPAYCIIDKLKIDRQTGENEKLHINVEFNLYLVGNDEK